MITTDSQLPVTDGACGASWYALRVRANHEKSVLRRLDYRALDAYLPLYSAPSRWSDRTKTLERVLFPGYVFTRLSNPAEALSVPGVCHLLGGLAPAVIPESEIQSVRLVIASMRPLVATDFAVGERVTVASGSLKGVEGIITRIKGALRLVVNVEMLGRGVAVELDADNLLKSHRSAAA